MKLSPLVFLPAGLLLVSCLFLNDQPDLCRDQLVVEITSTDGGVFPPSEYRAEVKLDGEIVRQITCKTKIASGETCSRGALELVSANGGRMLRLVFFAAPATATVAVWREEVLLGEQVFAPNYFQVSPNGAMDDPICLQSTVRMTVFN